jgi:hypothetical protein
VTVTSSYYHSSLGVDVPAYNLTTSWGADFNRFDNVGTSLWVLMQVREGVEE